MSDVPTTSPDACGAGGGESISGDYAGAEALAVAALRFWLSRLAGPVSEHSEGQGSKDPEEFARIFQWRIAALAG